MSQEKRDKLQLEKENTNQDETIIVQRLRQAFPQNQDMRFGGDFGQLLAVIMYAIEVVTFLKSRTIQRQAEDSKEQKIFLITVPFAIYDVGPRER
ncbi:19018_t:CDS:2, partial [Gigaspora rosea]